MIKLILLHMHLAFFLLVIPTFTYAEVPRIRPYTEKDIYEAHGQQYVVVFPQEFVATKKYPVLVDLHGGGLIWNAKIDNSSEILKGFNNINHGLPSLISQGFRPSAEIILVFPFLPRDYAVPEYNDQEWDVDNIHVVMEDMLQNKAFNIDSTRVYMSGISSGGKGVWDYAIAYPEMLAAIIPISGNANPSLLCKLNDVGVWVFHGEADKLINPFERSKIPGQEHRFGSAYLAEALKECEDRKYNPRLTLIPFVRHKRWDDYYNFGFEYDIYSWMLAFKKHNDKLMPPMVNAGADKKLVSWRKSYMLSPKTFDADGKIVAYNWTQTAGPPVKISQRNDTLLIHNMDVAGIYSFRIAVEDDSGLQATDEIFISLERRPFPWAPMLLLGLLVLTGIYFYTRYPLRA